MPLPLRPRAGLLLLAAAAAAHPLAAQDKDQSPRITWEVEAPRLGWCLYFLIEAKDADKDLPRGRVLIPASDATGLPAPVERLIRDEPKYGAWVPNQVCTYLADAVTLEGKRFEKGDGGQPISIVYWGVSAGGTGSGADTAKMALRVMATNSSGMERAMAIRSVPTDRVKVEVSPIKESDDLQYLVKMEGATILFAGHPRPDSTLSREEVHSLAAHQGNNQALWDVSFGFYPDHLETMAGSLRVMGKHGLAKALIRSPIRLLGPAVAGGRGVVEFTR